MVPAPHKRKKSKVTGTIKHSSCEVITQMLTRSQMRASQCKQTEQISIGRNKKSNQHEHPVTSSQTFRISGKGTQFESSVEFSKAVQIKKKISKTECTVCPKAKAKLKRLQIQIKSLQAEKKSLQKQLGLYEEWKQSVNSQPSSTEPIITFQEFDVQKLLKSGVSFNWIESELQRRGHSPNDDVWDQYEALKTALIAKRERQLKEEEKQRLLNRREELYQELQNITSEFLACKKKSENLAKNVSLMEDNVKDTEEEILAHESATEAEINKLSRDYEVVLEKVDKHRELLNETVEKRKAVTNAVVRYRLSGHPKFKCETCIGYHRRFRVAEGILVRLRNEANNLKGMERHLKSIKSQLFCQKDCLEAEIEYLKKKFIYTKMLNEKNTFHPACMLTLAKNKVHLDKLNAEYINECISEKTYLAKLSYVEKQNKKRQEECIDATYEKDSYSWY